jgi:choline dehydrogenase
MSLSDGKHDTTTPGVTIAQADTDAVAGAVASAAGLSGGGAAQPGRDAMSDPARAAEGLEESYDYIVVGSGAGGGPVAANLARAGHRVLLLEAGGDEEPAEYQVPLFHSLSTEHDDLRWSFYIRHYADDAQQARDRKFVIAADGAERNGILYPRAGTLGGCTAHNAMILVYPHNSDWDHIAELTGDPSWQAGNMRRYFERMERCEYADPPAAGRTDSSRHGFDGWLSTNVADPKLLLRDATLALMVKAAAKQSFETYTNSPRDFVRRLRTRLESHLDPNDWRRVEENFEGITFTPLTVAEGRRTGARERLRQTAQEFSQQLTIRLRALATRVLFDADNRAVGIEFLDGAHLYRADPRAPKEGNLTGPRRTVRATREVILAGGAFNTPQLLMLSGIGPAEELQRHGIEVRIDLPGVGHNLQDRYEVGVVTEMEENFPALQGVTFKAPGPGEQPDPHYAEWLEGRGLYTTNGAVTAIITRSAPERPMPDLYLFGVVGHFEGYFPGYSTFRLDKGDRFTWVILKAHTRNTGGRVRLRSADPQDVPDINFHFFDEGNNDAREDLDSVVAAVEYVREITARTPEIIKRELVPGADVASREQIAQYVKDNAWGHHASCSCPIGREDDPMAVLDSRFRVRGAKGLRVVDASVFPRIPGFFIVSAVYMVGEKASDVILEDAGTPEASPR